MRYFAAILIFFVLFTQNALGAVDPRTSANNKVGIGVLSPEADIEEAAAMVNDGSQWGWILIVIKKSERNIDRWQSVLHQLSKHKLIPIIRIATDFDERGYWQKPSENEAQEWADFLNKLYFPTKNRYIQVYNEVNRASEWGGAVDPEGYAAELKKTRDFLKEKSPDFFVLGAPLDLALSDSQDSVSAEKFFRRMEQARPGIFASLDGWASHSYPNPDFSASPLKSGRTGIDAYKWELSVIQPFTKNKDFPVFITETGWDRNQISDDEIAQFYKTAFDKVWSDKNVVAVTPFVFNYPDGLFHRFSFKRNGSQLGEKYYAPFETLRNLPKDSGLPVLDNLAKEESFFAPYYIITNEITPIKISLRNVGNEIWKSSNLRISLGDDDIQIVDVNWSKEEVFPGEQVVATFKVTIDIEGPLNFKTLAYDKDSLILEKAGSFFAETQIQRLVRIVREVFRA
jgi:hypothetical protein